MQINNIPNLYVTNMNKVSFGRRPSDRRVDMNDRMELYNEYKSGIKLEDLSKAHKISLSETASIIQERLILDDYLNTNLLENQIAKKYFVTRQTVASIIRTCGFSGEDRKRVTSDMVLAILDAQKSGLSSEEIVAKYAVKKEND